jgi:hypothetical protein
VQLARLLRFPPELSKDSHRRRLGGARETALCQYGVDCGESRSGHQFFAAACGGPEIAFANSVLQRASEKVY